MMCLFHHSINGAELKRRKCSDDVSMPSQYMVKSWKKDITCQFQCRIHGKETKGKQRRKEGTAHPLCHTCKAHHNHTKGCTVDSQCLWKGAFISRWNHYNHFCRWHHHYWCNYKLKAKEKRWQHHGDEFYAFYLKKEMKSLLGTKKLIDVTTNWWNCLEEDGTASPHPSVCYDEEIQYRCVPQCPHNTVVTI